MDQEAKTLAEVPTVLLMLVSMAGLLGEMRKASDIQTLSGKEIAKRVALRFGASSMAGVAAMMIAMQLWGNLMLSGSIGIATGLMGADAATMWYSRWGARKVGADGQAQ